MLNINNLIKYAAIWQALSQTASTQDVISPAIGIPSTLTDFSVPVQTRTSRVRLATSLIFGGYHGGYSVVTVNPTATTYLSTQQFNTRQGPTTECHPERLNSMLLVNGPSTAGITYYTDACDTTPAMTLEVNCPLTGPAPITTAFCQMTYRSGTNSVTTQSVTMNSSEIAPEPATITAGLEKLSASGGAVTVSLTTASVVTEEAPFTIQTSMPTIGQSGSPPQSTPTPAQTSPIQAVNGASSFSFAAGQVFISTLVIAVVMCVL